MIDAILMCGDLFLGVQQIPAFQRTIKIEWNTMATASVITTAVTNQSTTVDVGSGSFDITRNVLVFCAIRQLDSRQAEYQFEHSMSSQKYEFSMYTRNIELDEPTEAVNLNNLSAKLRDNIKAKELLLRYYDS